MLTDFGSVASTEGYGTVGSNSMRNFDQGMQFAGQALGDFAQAHLGKIERENSEKIAKLRAENISSGGGGAGVGAVGQALSGLKGIVGGMRGMAAPPAGNFASPDGYGTNADLGFGGGFDVGGVAGSMDFGAMDALGGGDFGGLWNF